MVTFPNDRPRRPCSFSPFSVSITAAKIINAIGNAYESKFLAKHLKRLAQSKISVEIQRYHLECIQNKLI